MQEINNTTEEDNLTLLKSCAINFLYGRSDRFNLEEVNYISGLSHKSFNIIDIYGNKAVGFDAQHHFGWKDFPTFRIEKCVEKCGAMYLAIQPVKGEE